MLKVIQADTVNARGLRNVLDGDLTMLKGFEFNEHAKLGITLRAPYSATIDRVTGELAVNLFTFTPKNLVSAPSGATHFKIISAGAEIDFPNGTFVAATEESDVEPWDMTPVGLTLTNAVTAASTKPLFLFLGIAFYQEVNTVMYPLKNGAYNALQLIKASIV
jgi:hypothetical protein